MGLSERLARAAVRRPHVLLVPVPGSEPLRWEAQDALDDLGWAPAASPAAADVLLVCGSPGAALGPHVDVAEEAMPGPRVRTTVTAPGQVRAALQDAAAALRDLDAQRRDAAQRPAPRLSAADSGSAEQGASTDMDLPGGLVMADRVEDRDGLRLEGLVLSLGPLLPGWPAGLRLDVVLSGDVLVRAEVVRLDPRPEPPVPAALRALDALGALLEAAGWSDGAVRARHARAAGGGSPATGDLLSRLRRARLLRWSLRGLPAPGGGDLAAHLDRLAAVARGQADLPTADERRLAGDLVGLDIGTAALVVAAHGPLLPAPAHV